MKISKILLASMLLSSVVAGQETLDTTLIKQPRIGRCEPMVSGVLINPPDTTLIVPEKDSSVIIQRPYKPCIACGRG